MYNFAKTSPGRVEPSAAVEPHPSAADFVHSLTCNECLKVYNAGNKTMLECGEGPHFVLFISSSVGSGSLMKNKNVSPISQLP